MNFKFKTENSLEERKRNSEALLKQFDDKIPLICEKDPKWKMESLPKTKFLVPNTMMWSQLIDMIKSKIKLDNKEALFLLIAGKHQVSGEKTLGEIFEAYKDEDGFLYVSYAGQLSWGMK